LEYFRNEIDTTLAWIGPHIGVEHYEVGDDVFDACVHRHDILEKAFHKNSAGRWQADLEMLARLELNLHGVERISAAGLCTYTRTDEFYSYRRDRTTGRTAGMIWMDK
jgi:copper oxidase (laccase) domain-containing protein